MTGKPVDERASRRWIEADGIHIDVRGLPPPQPMVSILALVESIREDTKRRAGSNAPVPADGAGGSAM